MSSTPVKIAIVSNPKLTALLEYCDEVKSGEVVIMEIIPNWRTLEEMTSVKDVDILLFSKPYSLETLSRLCSPAPALKLIEYSEANFALQSAGVFNFGVKSFIRSKDGVQELIKAIKTVHGGGFYLSEHVAHKVFKIFTLSAFKNTNASLSRLDRTVLAYICKGYSSKEIAGLIFKSPRTVEKYRQDLYSKFNVSNTIQLIDACRLVLLDEEP